MTHWSRWRYVYMRIPAIICVAVGAAVNDDSLFWFGMGAWIGVMFSDYSDF